MNNKRPRGINLKLHHLEGLNDEVFAIVVTLLGIELIVPAVPDDLSLKN